MIFLALEVVEGETEDYFGDTGLVGLLQDLGPEFLNLGEFLAGVFLGGAPGKVEAEGAFGDDGEVREGAGPLHLGEEVGVGEFFGVEGEGVLEFSEAFVALGELVGGVLDVGLDVRDADFVLVGGVEIVLEV